MRTFRANKELEKILLNHGFVENTTVNDEKTGNKSFKPTRLSRKIVSFKNNKIELLFRYALQESKEVITEEELKLLLLFCQLQPKDLNEFGPRIGRFVYEKAKAKLEEFKTEIPTLKDSPKRIFRKTRLSRIIDLYNAINIDKK